MHRSHWLTFIILLCFACTLSAAEFFVSPDGGTDGDGSKAKPLPLAHALSAKTSPAKPGDVIYLLPGRYDGPMKDNTRIPFELSVSGEKDKPIIVKPAPGTQPWNAPHLNGTLHWSASHTHLIGVEVGDLQWDVRGESHKNETALWATDGVDGKVINCNFFGGRMGSGIWKGAINFESYGSLIHDFGTVPTNGGRGSGHAVYTQNVDGTKVFRHNVFYRGAGWNFDIYTQGSDIDGYDVIENISFLASELHPSQSGFNFGVAGRVSADRIRFIGNVAYQHRDHEKWRGNTRMLLHDQYVDTHNKGEFRDNYVMGSYRAFSAGLWEHLTITGNTLWATGVIMEIARAPGGSGINDKALPKPPLSNYIVDNNTYIGNNLQTPFRYGAGVEIQEPEKMPPGEALTFEQWQSLGLDANGKFIAGKDGRPTGTKVFVFPNAHQKGRANVAAFNWDRKESVELDLSNVLTSGQEYRIYHLLDINQTISSATPVASGKYDGKSVVAPARRADNCPDFEAYLVLAN